MLREIVPGWCLGEIICLGLIIAGLIGVILGQIYLLIRERMKRDCKNCKYKVKYGLGCWHPSMDTGDDWNPEISRESCPHYKRKYW